MSDRHGSHVRTMRIELAIADRPWYRRFVKRTREDVAALVRIVRSRLGPTQEGFAHELGVSFSTVNGWENGKHLPLPVFVRQLRTIAGATAKRLNSATATRRTRKR